MSETILKVENLTKSYKTIKAVDDISFKVLKGQFFSFLGPNGAGKSTTIKMLTTLLKPDAGKIFLNDNENDFYIREKIGVVFQENILDNNLTVKENLLLRGALYIKDKTKLNQRYTELKKEFELEEIEKQKFKTLSGGQKRRVEIARALFADPEVLLLDEPTTGLDPESRKIVWQIIKNLRTKSGLTIILTTHYMEETNDSDYVVIIKKGKIVAEGSPSDLKEKYASDIFKIAPKNFKNLTDYLKSNKIKYERIADQVKIQITNTEHAIKILNENQSNIKSFEMIKGTMDDVFVNIVGEPKWEIFTF